MQSEEHGNETEILLQRSGKNGLLYQMTVTERIDAELGRFRTYGIRIGDAVIPDLSPNEEAVRRLVCTCAAQEVFPEQLQEIAEDFLGTVYGLP